MSTCHNSLSYFMGRKRMKGENRGWFGSAGNCRSLSRREVEYLLATLSMMADTPKAGAPVSFHPPQGKRMPGTRRTGCRLLPSGNDHGSHRVGPSPTYCE